MSTITKEPLVRRRSAGEPPVALRTKHRVHKGEHTLRNTVIAVIVVFNLVLLVYPISMAFAGSFHEWNPLKGTYEWLGLQNYIDLLSDRVFWQAATNTVAFGVVVIFFRVAIGLALAYAIYSRATRFKTFFRTIFYMPTVTPIVAVAYVWQLAFHPQIGFVNEIFGTNINWMHDKTWALPAVMVMTIWKDFGYAVILFLAGLYSLPEDSLEAASMDGANAWQRFRFIMFPLLRPMMLFVIVTSIIAYLQAYVQILVMTKGGPGTSTYLISFLIFDKAFVKYDFGYASAIAFILLIFTALLTLASFRLMGGRALFGKKARS